MREASSGECEPTCPCPLNCKTLTVTTWSCCGYGAYHHVSPSVLWLLVISLTLAAHRRHHLFADFCRSANELHDIQTQALGVVVARRKRIIFGKLRSDPKRLLMLGAMWAELGGFSYCAIQLLLYQLHDNTFYGQANGRWRLATFITLSLVLGFVECLPGGRFTRRFRPWRDKIGAPFLYDTVFMTFMYAIIDVAGCSNDLDAVSFGGQSCADPSLYWIFFGLGVMVFSAFFWGTLLYKKRLADDVYAVRFRFQTAFNALMTCTRTACALGFYTIEKALLVFDAWIVIFGFSAINLVLFGSLLYYNFRCQPCLGVGYFPNNLRALSFGTSCYTTLVLCLVTLLVHWTADRTLGLWVVQIAAGLYPLVAAGLWRWNSHRAKDYEVPNLDLLASLSHDCIRVRAIAAVSVTLENDARCDTEIQAIVVGLNDTLIFAMHHETAYAIAYACQAMWFLWYRNFDLSDQILESTSDPLWPLGRWAPEPRDCSSHSAKASMTHPATLVKKGFWQRRHVPSLATMDSALVRLVEKATDMDHTMCATNRIADAPVVHQCFENGVKKLIGLLYAPCYHARRIAAKTLQEMYDAGAIQVRKETFFQMAVTLVAVPVHSRAVAAARTLVSFVVTQEATWVASAMADKMTLVLVSEALVQRVFDVEFLSSVTQVLSTVMSTLVAMSTPQPVTYLSLPMVSALLSLQDMSVPPLVAAQIDTILANIHSSHHGESMTRRASFSTRVTPADKDMVVSTETVLLTPVQVAAVLDRQRQRHELLTAATTLIDDGFAQQRTMLELQPSTRVAVEAAFPQGQAPPRMLGYVESQVPAAAFAYVCRIAHLEPPGPRTASLARIASLTRVRPASIDAYVDEKGIVQCSGFS
ncbi:hypothetical protein SDRG_07387 [Saprolegnia diclina VS20]|uniref:Uncharacterized protein n=1 Tax=Saprolegnia diclina (strain VS20) TaxID=1156394 RepID=T0QMV0_SAPDV|nr:hypothetical protein SDRG_07387 [Saprolegnia diclina VS20]EQC35155.1 hypothetical protein SDRG_07387 [Saprolegnia diclina VS20]|eukprot:XP_008611439.1 hypothetical protein SDRG_07387 [Saprolegnia diclina VS20]